MLRALIEIKNLVKKYGSNTAVRNISFTVDEGKVYGFLGPNGAGKSTTMNIITGCLAATDGTVLINGHDIFKEPVLAKKNIGYLPEQPPLYMDMTPYEYLRFVGEAKGLRSSELDAQVREVIELTQLSGMEKRLIKNLSKGYKQRVGIAQAMLGDPKVIILDEPTVGLDPKQILEIRELIRSLSKGRTVILSSHILTEISAVCDHVMIISKGRLVANDSLSELEAKYTGKNRLIVQTKASVDNAPSIVSDIEGIDSVTCEPTGEAGVCKLIISYSNGTDLREAVYRAFCKTEYPILSMVHEETTLEDIFLRLTEEDLTDEESDADISDADKPDTDTDENGGNEKSGDKDSGDDYKPLFS